MDVSGSMDEQRKDLAKRFFILLYLFLKRNYEKIEVVFIRHHTRAEEVDEDTFFHSTESGGTVVSTPEGMFDGRWEVGAVLDEAFAEQIRDYVPDERQKAVVFALRDAVKASKHDLTVQGVPLRTMDVWVATIHPNV